MATWRRWRRSGSSGSDPGPTPVATGSDAPGTPADDAEPVTVEKVTGEAEEPGSATSRPRRRPRRKAASTPPGGATPDVGEGAVLVAEAPDGVDRDGGEPDEVERDGDTRDGDATKPTSSARLRRRVRDAAPVLLLRAAHPRQALLTALVLGGAAAVAGRPAREAVAVLLTVLVGQSAIGWHNDLVDARRDARHDVAGKPVADRRLDAGTVWYVLVVAVLVLVPLSITTGITAGVYYLLSVAVAMLGHYVLRRGIWSWVPWAASFALLPAYLSFGGWGGQAEGGPPEPLVVVLAALLGVGVHLVRAVWGLVADHADGWRSLPLRLGLRLGATRLLTVGSVYLVVVGVALAVAATQVGLSR